MLELIHNLSTLFLPPFIYLFVEHIKSKRLSNKIEQLRKDIEFTKQTDKELSYALTDVYHSCVFQLTFGFKILPSRVKGYTQLFRESNISVTTFRYFHKRHYIIYDQEKQTPNLKITKGSKIQMFIDWIVFSILFITGLSLVIFAQNIINILNLGVLSLIGYTILVVFGLLCYIFSIRNLIVSIIPYYDANKVIKRKLQMANTNNDMTLEIGENFKTQKPPAN